MSNCDYKATCYNQMSWIQIRYMYYLIFNTRLKRFVFDITEKWENGDNTNYIINKRTWIYSWVSIIYFYIPYRLQVIFIIT